MTTSSIVTVCTWFLQGQSRLAEDAYREALSVFRSLHTPEDAGIVAQQLAAHYMNSYVCLHMLAIEHCVAVSPLSRRSEFALAAQCYTEASELYATVFGVHDKRVADMVVAASRAEAEVKSSKPGVVAWTDTQLSLFRPSPL